MMSGWQAKTVPRFQEPDLRFAITICGSALDWCKMAPRCFQGSVINTPVLSIFGKGDITKYGRKKEKDGFMDWFQSKTCSRFEHSGLHSCFSGRVSDINMQLDVMLKFVDDRCTPSHALDA